MNATICIYNKGPAGAQERKLRNQESLKRDDTEFRTRFFDLGVEKIYQDRSENATICICSEGPVGALAFAAAGSVNQI
ncbi:hypothetical protein DHD08_06630 [Arenibacter sp. H213]|nr:hypothetical protein [Arenibacter sp. H213]